MLDTQNDDLGVSESDCDQGLTGPSLPLSNAERIDRSASICIPRLMLFLRANGVEVEFDDPTFKYFDEVCEYNPSIFCAVNKVAKSSDDVSEKIILWSVYKKLFDLDLSDEIIGELHQVGGYKFDDEYSNGYLDMDEDIAIFKPMTQYIDRIASVLLHEIWHLLEFRMGLFDGANFLHEVTATYVQFRSCGVKMDFDVNSDCSAVDVPYRMGPVIVDEVIGGSETWLQDLLDPKIRAKIKERLEQEMIPVYLDKFGHTIDIDIFMRQSAYIFERNLDSFGEFVEDPTPENLIVCYEKYGCEKFAKHLRSLPDIDQIFNYFRSVVSSYMN